MVHVGMTVANILKKIKLESVDIKRLRFINLKV